MPEAEEEVSEEWVGVPEVPEDTDVPEAEEEVSLRVGVPEVPEDLDDVPDAEEVVGCMTMSSGNQEPLADLSPGGSDIRQ